MRGITELDLAGCSNLTELPANLPASLTKLNLFRCRNLRALPAKLPKGMTELDLSGCENLTELPDDLPASLTKLNISGCRNLRALPAKLPDGITELNLSECENLTELLGNLPASFTKLDLSGCHSLPNTPAFIKQLLELEDANQHNPDFTLIWPEHLNKDITATTINNNLTEAYETYWREDPDKSASFYRNGRLTKRPSAADPADCPTFVVVHRFMTEQSIVRGGMACLVQSMRPVIDAIKTNPSLLKITDEIARASLEGCINQPTQGFIEMSFITTISSKTTIQEKLDAARKLLILDCVNKESIAELKSDSGAAVGESVEVELCNAMLMVVYDKLYKEGIIKEQWMGIPRGVAYRAAIESFLTSENVSIVAKKVQEILDAPLSEIAAKICDGHYQDIWADFIISKDEISELDACTKLIELEGIFAKMESENGGYTETAQAIAETTARLRYEKLRLSAEKTMSSLEPSPAVEGHEVRILAKGPVGATPFACNVM